MVAITLTSLKNMNFSKKVSVDRLNYSVLLKTAVKVLAFSTMNKYFLNDTFFGKVYIKVCVVT